MRIFYRLSSLLLIIIIFISLAGNTAFADTPTISGKVTNQSGSPIVNSTIVIIDSVTSETVSNVTTDANGNYSLNLQAGTYNIKVTPPAESGFQSTTLKNQTITVSKVINFVLVAVQPIPSLITVSGHILDTGGNPISGVNVSLGSGSTTDANGFYFVQLNTDTSYAISISTPHGEFFSRFDLQPFTENTTFDIILPQPHTLTVAVSNPDGDPVANAGVQFDVQGNEISVNSTLGQLTFIQTKREGLGSSTNSEGKASLVVYPAGVAISISSPTSIWNNASTGLFVSNDTTVPVQLTNAPVPVTVSGQITDSDGNGVTGASINLFSNTGGGGGITNSSGNYSFQVIAGNSYGITITPPTGTSTLPGNSLTTTNPSHPLNITSATTLNVQLPEVHNFTIAVNNSINEPVPHSGLEIEVSGQAIPVTTSLGNLSLQVDKLVLGAATNIDGEYSFLAYQSNANIIVTSPTSTLQNVTTSAGITEDATFPIILPDTQVPVTISGQILDSGGNPISNANVSFGGNSGITDENGYYTAQILKGQSYALTINVDNPDFPQDIQFLSQSLLPPFISNTTFNLTLPQPHTLTIDVINPLGEALVGAGIIYNVAGQNISIPSTLGNITFTQSKRDDIGSSTDSNGKSFLLMYPGSVDITITPPNGSMYLPYTFGTALGATDQTQVVSLQYNHVPPHTTISLATLRDDGDYSDPTTVTLSATAGEGYTIENTFYKLDNGTQETYTSPFTISGSGSHTIEYWSVDNSGVQEEHKTKIFTIHQNQAPVVDPFPGATINEGELFTTSSTFTDLDSTSWTATVDYDEGAGPEPLELNPDKTFSLSNKYEDNDVYTVTVVIRDNQQATGTTFATVIVNNIIPDVGTISASVNPVQVNTSTTATANFTDVGVIDGHTATWNWGDGQTNSCPSNSSQCTLIESNGSGTVTGSHTYTLPGVYEISLRINDGSGFRDAPIYQYVVVYSPTITKVDGAKEFNSPLSASIPNAGKVEFGFHGDYVNNVLQGNASLSFGNTDFKSDYLDWLVINGDNVTLQATGTIKHQAGTYRLIISATDLAPKNQSEGVDLVRVKLYNVANNNILYDSQLNTPENGAPTTTIFKGDIEVL